MKALALIQTEKQDILLRALEAIGPVPVEAAQKIDYMAKLNDFIEQEAASLAEEIKAAQTKKRSIEKAGETLAKFVKSEMSEEGLCSIEGDLFRFNLSDSQGKLIIDDETLIPDEFFVTETIKSPNTKLIKAMLESGQMIEGCSIEKGHRLTIKAKNKE